MKHGVAERSRSFNEVGVVRLLLAWRTFRAETEWQVGWYMEEESEWLLAEKQKDEVSSEKHHC